MRKNHWHYVLFLLLWLPGMSFAANQSMDLGTFADSMIEPVGMLSDFISTGSIIIGIGCIFGSFLRYSQYRINPVASPLSSVIILLILGIALLCLPLLNYVLGDNVAFLHK